MDIDLKDCIHWLLCVDQYQTTYYIIMYEYYSCVFRGTQHTFKTGSEIFHSGIIQKELKSNNKNYYPTGKVEKYKDCLI